MIKKQYLKSKPICKVTFSLPKEAATEATDVRLLGDFNDWNQNAAPQLKRGRSEFKTTVELPVGQKYEFRYLIDGEEWMNDWAADEYVNAPYAGVENSVVVLENTIVATKSKKDNLKKIEGIGPKIEKLMKEAGITTFKGLANADIEVLKEILAAAGPRFRMHNPGSWSLQAQLAAKGSWDELEALQAELKGGR